MAKQQAEPQTKQGSIHPLRDAEPESWTLQRDTDPDGDADDADDEHVYGLASNLYHALQGVAAVRKYQQYAKRVG